MKHIALMLLIAILSVFIVAGCKVTSGGAKADPAAQAACKEKAKDADTCKKCCSEAGASGHMFMTGSGCKCL